MFKQAKQAKTSKKCIDQGHEDGFEHGYAIDIRDNTFRHFTSGMEGEVFGPEFFAYLENRPKGSIITIHNHSDNRGFSYVDMNTMCTEPVLKANIAACHNGDAFVVEGLIKKLENWISYDEIDFCEDIKESLREKEVKGIITTSQRIEQLEELVCKRIAKKYFKKYTEVKT